MCDVFVALFGGYRACLQYDTHDSSSSKSGGGGSVNSSTSSNNGSHHRRNLSTSLTSPPISPNTSTNTTNNNHTSTFNFTAFLQTVPPPFRSCLQIISRTQSFERFISTRSQLPHSDYFESRVQTVLHQHMCNVQSESQRSLKCVVYAKKQHFLFKHTWPLQLLSLNDMILKWSRKTIVSLPHSTNHNHSSTGTGGVGQNNSKMNTATTSLTHTANSLHQVIVNDIQGESLSLVKDHTLIGMVNFDSEYGDYYIYNQTEPVSVGVRKYLTYTLTKYKTEFHKVPAPTIYPCLLVNTQTLKHTLLFLKDWPTALSLLRKVSFRVSTHTHSSIQHLYVSSTKLGHGPVAPDRTNTRLRPAVNSLRSAIYRQSVLGNALPSVPRASLPAYSTLFQQVDEADGGGDDVVHDDGMNDDSNNTNNNNIMNTTTNNNTVDGTSTDDDAQRLSQLQSCMRELTLQQNLSHSDSNVHSDYDLLEGMPRRSSICVSLYVDSEAGGDLLNYMATPTHGIPHNIEGHLHHHHHHHMNDGMGM